MAVDVMNGYDHTQKGIVHWLVFVTGLFCLWTAATAVESMEHWWVLLIAVALFFGLTPCFAHLRVRDLGDELEIAFGPVRAFKRTVRYDQVTDVAIGRSTLIDGWGIHRTPGRGWIWNIHGFRCVELDLRDGSRLRIGTDEPERLDAYLRTRIGAD
jgi:hypothetical protein